MTKQEINTRLGELLQLEMSSELIAEAKNLLSRYQTTVATAHKEQLEAFLADGGDKAGFEPQRDEEDATFDTLWTKFAQGAKSWEKEVAETREQHLDQKKNIIASIEALVHEEHIGKAMTRIRELQEEWKTIGTIASNEYAQLQAEYSRVRDEFYYNMRIYRELLEHDLKRNLQLKEELAEKMEALLTVESLKEVEGSARQYNNEWDEIGPTFREKWEEVRDRFRAAQRQVYDRLNNHYQTLRDKQSENLEKKQQLCERIEKMLEQEIKSEKRWRRLTEEVKAAQKEWKTIGFVPKKDNEAIWTRFKAAGDAFFQRKSAFYKELKEEQDKNRDQKRELVEKAEALKESTNWKETSDVLINLQNRWQKIGTAHQRDEQRLWKQFRAACNAFFEHKKNFYATKDQRQAGNLKAKQEALQVLQQAVLEGDHIHKLMQLDELADAYHAQGFVPLDKKGELAQTYRKALRNHYASLNLGEADIQRALFYQKLRELSASDNKNTLLEREERHLRDKAKKLEGTIQQYDNNLGFFGHSKGAEKLREQAEKQLDESRQQLEELQDKLNLIDRAFNDKLRNPLVSAKELKAYQQQQAEKAVEAEHTVQEAEEATTEAPEAEAPEATAETPAEQVEASAEPEVKADAEEAPDAQQEAATAEEETTETAPEQPEATAENETESSNPDEVATPNTDAPEDSEKS